MSSTVDVEDAGRSEAVRVRLLGGFRVSVGPRAITQDAWRLRKAAALVKLLALASGHRLHREQAMDLLWPDANRRASSNSLRSILHAARKILDPTMGSRYLASEDETLVLCPEGDLWVDVDAFEEAAATARRAKEPATYRVAIDLYGGDLLPEDRYEEWTEGRRNELRQLYLALLVELAGLYEERREHDLAIEVLLKVTAEEPTSEEAHVALMRLHALLGRPERALAQYERLRDTLSRGLGTQPAASSHSLRDEIAAGNLSMTPAGPSQEEERFGAGKHNLPSPRTSFVGREREMVEVRRELATTRLLTLTGAGGSGKTRLALEVARDLIGVYPDGVWLVGLAGLSEGDLIPQTVAAALRVPERPGQALTDTLMETLSDNELLLILDNCEHLVEEAAHLVDTLLDSCPHLRVLATSREPLDISGEVNRVVPLLSLPARTDEEFDKGPTVDRLMGYEAIRLFVDRARLRLPDFELTQQNAGAVARVCWKLDGMPLAIELATARMGALAVEQVAQRLDVSLDVLSGTNRTVAPRQQTLRATIDWSHRLLAEEEQKIFRRFSVFAGGWTLETAEAVCSGGGIKQGDVLDLLGGLVDKSLVAAAAATGGTVRYKMLEPIRQYARQKLEEIGEADEVRDRHAASFLALAEDTEPELAGQQQGAWVEWLEGEHDNMREALSWFLERGEGELALRLGAALWRFWHARGYLSEGIRWLERVLTDDDSTTSPARVKALEGMGWLVQLQGDYKRARATYEEMLELSKELDDKGNIATALNSLGTVAAQHGDNERARTLLQENLEVIGELEEEGDPASLLKKFYVFNLLGYLAINEEDDYAQGTTLWEESLALAREAGDTYLVGNTLSNLGHPALMQRDYERAKTLSEEALKVAHESGGASAGFAASALINLGIAALGLGEHELAMGSFQDTLLVSQDMGAKPQVIESLEGMASISGALRKDTRAAHLWGAAEMAREVTGIALSSGERSLHEPYLLSARGRLGEIAWEEALAEGQAMSLEEAAEYAVASEEQPATLTLRAPEEPSADQQPVPLSPREQEVARLASRELSNYQIASQLVLSEHTVATHIRNILKKLGLRSRTQIAAYFTEQQ